MSKYIDAEKLIERLEEMKRAEYENCGGVNSKTGALQEVQELIASLQQEQPEMSIENFDKEVTKIWGRCAAEPNDTLACFHIETFIDIARHFYNLGIKVRKNRI